MHDLSKRLTQFAQHSNYGSDPFFWNTLYHAYEFYCIVCLQTIMQKGEMEVLEVGF